MIDEDADVKATKVLTFVKDVLKQKRQRTKADRARPRGIVKSAKDIKEVSQARARSNVSPIPYDAAKTDYFKSGLTLAGTPNNQDVIPPQAIDPRLWKPVDTTSPSLQPVFAPSVPAVNSKRSVTGPDRTIVNNVYFNPSGPNPRPESGKLFDRLAGNMQRTAENNGTAVAGRKKLDARVQAKEDSAPLKENSTIKGSAATSVLLKRPEALRKADLTSCFFQNLAKPAVKSATTSTLKFIAVERNCDCLCTCPCDGEHKGNQDFECPCVDCLRVHDEAKEYFNTAAVKRARYRNCMCRCYCKMSKVRPGYVLCVCDVACKCPLVMKGEIKKGAVRASGKEKHMEGDKASGAK
jgi:hypothetical protein